MAKLSLKAAPTFTTKVGIPVAGGAAVDVMLTYRHRTRKQMDQFNQERSARSDVESFLDMVVGWDLEDPFTPENVAELLENYIGAAVVAYQVYVDEIIKVRLGN